MGYFTLQPQVATDNATQDRLGTNYFPGSPTIASSELRLRQAPAANNPIKDVGIRFPGSLIIPAGTKAVTIANLKLYTASGTTGIHADIYLQKSLASNNGATPTLHSPAPFLTPNFSFAANDVYHRDRTTNSVEWNITIANGTRVPTDEEPDLRILFKELLRDAGAVFTDYNDPNDLIAISPTTVDIENPVVIIRPRIDPVIQELRIVGCGTNPGALERLQIASLELNVTLDEPPQAPSDKRTHFAILSDSYCWSMQPDLSFVGNGYENAIVDTKASTAYAGQIYAEGFFRVPRPPRGFVSIFVGNQAYSIDDPYGDGGMGAIAPEGRSGYTRMGILKDRLIQQFGVSESDVVIHPFGLGGTTASAAGRSQGIWSSASRRSDPVVNLDANDPDAVVNELWRFRDPHGHDAIELLQDTTIERLIVIYIGGGNDVFALTYGAGYIGLDPYGLIPMSRAQDSWDTLKSTIEDAYKSIARFCKGVREDSGANPIEFIIPGYPNLPTDEPRVPPINVYESEPPYGAFHRGTFPPASDPDAEYGDGTPGGYMRPYGDWDTENPIPHIPFFLAYSSLTDTAQTNVPGIVIDNLPRAMEKEDLGYCWQIRSLSYCWGNFFLDYTNNVYAYWYAHWAADHYGGGFSDFALPYISPNVNRWNNAKGFFAFSWGAYPYSAAASNNFPYYNLKIAFPYCARYITNESVNSAFQYATGEAAKDAIEELSTVDNLTCQYVELWDSLNYEDPDTNVGQGITQSAGLWASLDSVHLTKEGATVWVDAFILKARNNSPMLSTLTDWNSESIARFMPFMHEGW